MSLQHAPVHENLLFSEESIFQQAVTLLDNGFKEATKDLNSIARANLRQARMIGEWLIQIIAKIPPHAEPISRMPHQQAFGANVLEKHHELELEKHELDQSRDDHRVHRSHARILAQTRDRVCAQMSIEVILRHQLF